jgi:hypothetical protein
LNLRLLLTLGLRLPSVPLTKTRLFVLELLRSTSILLALVAVPLRSPTNDVLLTLFNPDTEVILPPRLTEVEHYQLHQI